MVVAGLSTKTLKHPDDLRINDRRYMKKGCVSKIMNITAIPIPDLVAGT
jgi:hypothetical protein